MDHVEAAYERETFVLLSIPCHHYSTVTIYHRNGHNAQQSLRPIYDNGKVQHPLHRRPGHGLYADWV